MIRIIICGFPLVMYGMNPNQKQLAKNTMHTAHMQYFDCYYYKHEPSKLMKESIEDRKKEGNGRENCIRPVGEKT